MGCGRLEPNPCKHSIFPSAPLSLPNFPCGDAWRLHEDPEPCLLLGWISCLGCLCHFPLSVLLLQTDKEDELSWHIKNLLGDVGSKVLLSHEAPLNPLWIPKKPKPKSRSCSHRPASRKTSPYADIWRESSPESLDLTPNPEQTYDDSNEGHSKQRSEAKAAPSKILPGPVQAKKPMDEPLIEDILREMSSSLPPFPSTLLTHPRAETSKLPLAPKPKPSTSRKWHLDNLVTQTKQGAVPREGPRDIGCGIGREERKKPELGISSNSCQQHSKAREPPHRICGQPDKKSQKFFCPVANNSEKSSGKGPMTSQKSCGQETKDPYKNFGQGAKDFHKSSGKVVRDSQESSRQVAKYPERALARNTVGIKRPGEPLVHNETKRVWNVEINPGPWQVTDQSCKDQLKDKKTMMPKAMDRQYRPEAGTSRAL
ncbi:hypothetical protein DUI87_08603 [Hirundo rustica rustica]|uniref:Uncharacterized protein n=1 Tax=Hirundo rustica rustica TaxID=333673 RepID=A0A3M0L2K6_HIRRU|nr:hypothetical protein DUI87_08603 [Hirundo rustica rustica]